MAASQRIWGACRSLALRPLPAPRAAFGRRIAAPVSRFYSNETTPTATNGPTSSIANDIPEDRIDDEMLETLLYGGRVSANQQEGGLTAAQEEMLYRGGAIPPAQEAAALLAKEESLAAIEDGLQNPGHKFPLPVLPLGEGSKLKARYHPVLEQLSRLVMRDGKLSVAQRVRHHPLLF